MRCSTVWFILPVTGFGGTTQISKEAPKIVIDEPVRVRFDTNVQTDLAWNFKASKSLYDIKPGKVYKVEFEVENFGKEPSSGLQVTMFLHQLLANISIN